MNKQSAFFDVKPSVMFSTEQNAQLNLLHSLREEFANTDLTKECAFVVNDLLDKYDLKVKGYL